MSRAAILLGFTIGGIGWLLLGPAPWLHLPRSVSLLSFKMPGQNVGQNVFLIKTVCKTCFIQHNRPNLSL